MPQEAFYAEKDGSGCLKEVTRRFCKAAYANGVRYLVIDEEIEKRSPGLFGKIKRRRLDRIKDIREGSENEVFEIVQKGSRKRDGESARPGTSETEMKGTIEGILSLRKVVFAETEKDKLDPGFWRWEFNDGP